MLSNRKVIKTCKSSSKSHPIFGFLHNVMIFSSEARADNLKQPIRLHHFQSNILQLLDLEFFKRAHIATFEGFLALN